MKLIVMAGGAGTRLWPLSRASHPKQFIKFGTDKSLMQEAILRVRALSDGSPTIVCNKGARFMVAEQLQSIGVKDAAILLEPVRRNTAPAVGLAALHALDQGTDPELLVLAADRVIKDIPAFHRAIKDAQVHASAGKIVTFGVVPTRAETGYGYIKKGQDVKSGHLVDAFVEKPILSDAKKFLESGNYLWNSGMFMFKASTYINELQELAPDIYKACRESIDNSIVDLDFIRMPEDVFSQSPSDSIDFAIMEKTNSAVVIPLASEWSDVGDWSSMYAVSEKDANQNVLVGDVLSIDSSDSYIRSDDRLVAVVGVDNLVIVDTKDALLVAHKDRTQDVKKLVDELESHEYPHAKFHREVHRPWGKYDSVDSGERYQVKRITVNPGAKLSLQKHYHRAEHWIVVSGSAKVTKGESEILLSENQSTYIPVGEVHCLENPGKIPLELIEVQSGSYLGEDDIVRIDDVYGRA